MTTAITNDIVRVVLFVLAWVNSILVSTGHKTLPVIDEAQVYWVITFIVSVWAMVKEAPFKHLFASKPASESPVEAPTAPAIDASKVTVAPIAAEPVTPVQVSNVEAPIAQPNAPTAPAVDAPADAAPKTN